MEAAAQNELFSEVRDGRALHVLDDGAYHEAMCRAGHLLATRARTEREVVDRLSGAGFDPVVTERVLARLRDLKLVDDGEFSRRWVEERSRAKGLSGEALIEELVAKGVERETARSAVGDACIDEAATAAALASRLVRKVARRPLAEQAAHLGQMLIRRGYSAEVASGAVRAVLPPEGWD